MLLPEIQHRMLTSRENGDQLTPLSDSEWQLLLETSLPLLTVDPALALTADVRASDGEALAPCVANFRA